MSSGIVAEIKSKLPVLDVVGESVALKRAGSAYKGLCPFHAEKTPSFVVTPDRETWHCFGCGEHGDIFTFLMRRDGLEFREALRRLAEKAGVELSERSASEDRHRARLRDALEQSIAWYREVLRQAHQAERARTYLAERGLQEDTLEHFGIGYALNTWDALTRRMRDRGFKDADLIAAGLASPSTRGGVYDRFRGRIIIPIRDQSGRAMGLGGRILPDAEGPKYLNSPSTILFDKSRTLYAIDMAKAAIRREKLAVIVEGYTDVMAAHQAGFTNVVASLGTALTRGQVELATRYADAVALAYDVDLAGEAATQRGLLEELGPDTAVSKVRVVRIPSGKDPDELVRSDPDAWRRAVAEARPVMEYFMDRAAASVDLGTAAGRREVAERVLALLRLVPSPIERDAHIPELARRTGIDERVLREALARGPRQLPRPRPAEPLAGEQAGATVLPPLEAEAIGLLLRYPTLAAEVAGEEPMPLRDEVARTLAAAWLAAVRAAGDGVPALGEFLGSLDAASADVARSLLGDGAAPRLEPESAREGLRVCLLRLRVERIEERLRNGRLLLEEAQRDSDRARLEEIERQMDQLGRQKAEATRAMHEPVTVAGARRS